MVAEERCVRCDAHGRTQVIFLDNASGHSANDSTREILQKTNIELRFQPPNSIDLCQPADANVIQQLNRVWKDEWEKE